ncbi:type A chloramphenicol O-acetyltransferase [Aureibacillus halotolerans]|uniref:Chloramphenicol acetyltransferase n=1 Tax=Aureibacillus halotolerans TaxID=1508390 RepID=A0A4V3D5S8_9BACI|nr:type A chloramphenicol O-acetyltransferase [Aureibacillus halotolerans]TDQ41197.1 chloramphenicol O-acetyltransferase type A [Aureibacillus halotolerans]
MKFNLIDVESWQRKEIFNHFLKQQTTFSITTEIDITVLYQMIKQKGYKFYPAFIFLVTSVVNSNKAFRMNFNRKGQLGYWDKVDPMYTVFNRESETFSGIWTEVKHDFKGFHDMYLSDVKKYNGTGKLFPKTPLPENTVSISMIPWTSFTGFNLNINSNPNHLPPIITGGKFVENGDSIYLPVSLQIHHAVCDGYHAGVFMNNVRQMAEHPAEWIL